MTLPLALSSAFAQETGTASTVTISGYGTVATTKTNTDETQVARPNQASSVGKTARAGGDSNFGVLGTVGVNS